MFRNRMSVQYAACSPNAIIQITDDKIQQGTAKSSCVFALNTIKKERKQMQWSRFQFDSWHAVYRSLQYCGDVSIYSRVL